MSKELNHIEERYKRRENINDFSLYPDFVVRERTEIYSQVIKKHFGDLSEVKVLEVGAGSGVNIEFFKSIGILPQHIYANELLKDRIEILKQNHPDIHIIEGDARQISESNFDIVFQSTVFTSILDNGFRKELSDKMWSLLKSNGIILWYDFTFNNPNNKDVKKVSKQELLYLFPKENLIRMNKVTLAPPIGRRVGKAYSFFNFFPFLRSHLIAVFKK